MSRQEDLQKLIANHSRRLQKLREQAAGFGPLHTPAHILTEIEDTEAEIQRLQTELATVEETAKESPQPKLAASPAVAAPVSPAAAADPQMAALRAQPRIFLCHANEDKPRVKVLYHQLKTAGYRPWLDRFDLLPGQNWRREIEKIITDPYNIIVICLSSNSTTKQGVVQQEIKWALDGLDKMPEDTIYVIPARLEACQPPDRLSDLHWVDLFEEDGFEYLTRALDYEISKRQKEPELKPEPAAPVKISAPPQTGPKATILPKILTPQQPFEPELILIPAGEFLMGSDPQKDKLAKKDEQPQHTLYLPDYYIAKTPVTNAQYATFVQVTGHEPPGHWKNGQPQAGEQDHPVVKISWHDAVAYCNWLSEVTSKLYRLPTEAEWEKAARGPDGRIYPWGNRWEARRCNTREGGPGKTTPVGAYLEGASPYGLLDMAGNVWEWCATKWGKSYPYDVSEDEWMDDDLKGSEFRALRGGSFLYSQFNARCASRDFILPHLRSGKFGFRLVVSPI